MAYRKSNPPVYFSVIYVYPNECLNVPCTLLLNFFFCCWGKYIGFISTYLSTLSFIICYCLGYGFYIFVKNYFLCDDAWKNDCHSKTNIFFHFHALIVFACPWKNQPKNNLTNKTMENEVYFMSYWLGSRTMCILSNSRSKLLPEAIKQINCKDIKHSKYLVPRIEWFQSKLWHDRIDYMRSFYICWIND